MPAPLARRAHRNGHDAGLGGRVVHLTDRAAQSGDRGDVHDLSVADLVRLVTGPAGPQATCDLRAVEDAGQVHVENGIPVFIGQVGDHGRAADGRVVD